MSRDFLIIGGGIAGLAIALELALRGAKVTVVSSNFAHAAAHAAAGMLAPQAEHLPPGAMQELCLFSRSLYKDWTAKIEHLTGLPTGYWECGILAPEYTSTTNKFSKSSLPPLTSPYLPLPPSSYLNQESIHHHQPGLNPQVTGGWWYPQDGQIDNRLLIRALRSAVESLGVTILEGEQVREFQIRAGKIAGVLMSNHELQSDRYILATGAWSQDLLPVPVFPKKGQMLAVQMQGYADDSSDSRAIAVTSSPIGEQSRTGPLTQVLYGEETYIVPRRDGRVIIGATSENVGFLQGNTPQGILQLLQAAIALYPALQDTILLEQWWGFRPATADELPILGSSPYPNLTLAVGHYRNGILLAPATGLLIADFILKNQTPPYWNAFSWERFG